MWPTGAFTRKRLAELQGFSPTKGGPTQSGDGYSAKAKGKEESMEKAKVNAKVKEKEMERAKAKESTARGHSSEAPENSETLFVHEARSIMPLRRRMVRVSSRQEV